MSNDSQGAVPANTSSELAGPAGGPFTPPTDEVRTVRPFALFEGKDSLFDKDLRPLPEVPVAEEEDPTPDPKDSPAPESASSSPSIETVETEVLSGSSASQDETASAEKDSGKPKESESGTLPF